MKILQQSFIIFLMVTMFMGCSIIGCALNVPIEKIYGKYKTTYPFGTETITLNKDGSFVQTVTMTGQSPVIFRGKWSLETYGCGSYVTFDDFMIVVDFAGELLKDWQTVKPGGASFDIEMHWFQIIMGSGLEYPYYKQ